MADAEAIRKSVTQAAIEAARSAVLAIRQTSKERRVPSTGVREVSSRKTARPR